MVSLLGAKPRMSVHLNKVVILQKRVVRLMYFSDYTSHSAPLFACSGILPIKMLYFKSVVSLLHDIENHCAPPNISQLFTRSEQVHSYSTRFFSSWKLLYKTGKNKSSVAFFFQSWCENHGIASPPLNFVG